MQIVPQPHMALSYQLGAMSLNAPLMQPPPPPPAAMMPPHSALPAARAAPLVPGSAMGYAPTGALAVVAPGQPPFGGEAPQHVMVIGTDSKTVKVRGLPFRATPIDILAFFEGYDHIVESLQLGVDALGRPSGEAWLTFTSGDEALRAVRERNRHYLGNRYLELNLT